MANSAYASGFNTDALFVAAKAATVFAAHEQSLFLGGGMIPVVNAPNGLLQVPELAAVTATTLTSEAAPGVDLDAVLPADTKNTIQCDIYAARSVLRDLGAIDPAEIGRVLGNAVSKAFDTAVISAMGGLTGQEIAGTTPAGVLTVDEIFDAVATIRGNGETSALMGVIGSAAAAELMKDIGTNAYAGGDFQSEAMRNGFVGTVGGVRLFQSSYVSGTNKGFIFAGDAMRIAMQKNVDIETARRPEAVGQDIVASLHAGVGVIDAGRGVKITDAA